MRAYTDEYTQDNVWDFSVKNGKLLIVDNAVADEQRAIISAFLQRGTVPQAPGLGIQWVEVLTGDVMPQEVNNQIRDAIMEVTGGAKYFPKYSMKNGMLSVEVEKA